MSLFSRLKHESIKDWDEEGREGREGGGGSLREGWRGGLESPEWNWFCFLVMPLRLACFPLHCYDSRGLVATFLLGESRVYICGHVFSFSPYRFSSRASVVVSLRSSFTPPSCPPSTPLFLLLSISCPIPPPPPHPFFLPVPFTQFFLVILVLISHLHLILFFAVLVTQFSFILLP